MHETARSGEVAFPGAQEPAKGTDGGRWAAKVGRVFEIADVRMNGGRSWDVRVNHLGFYRRVALNGLLGFGEAYVDGWWDCDALDVLFDRSLRAGLSDFVPPTRQAVVAYLKHSFLNLQRMGLARKNVEAHYHLGTELFRATLDERMVYTCGYWKEAKDLATAQEAKLDLVCRKIGLQRGQRVLDIGCGWGSFAKFAAERYGASVVGANISSQQVEYGRETCKGLPVEFRLQDYRQIDERFDHVVSIGCVEHVGPKNLRVFMETVRRCVRDEGLCLLHFFAGQRSVPTLYDTELLWINKYIFPGLVVPSLRQVGRAVEGLFVTEDLHNIGSDYDPTLMAWSANFDRNWPTLKEAYGDRFYRTWKYYLLSAAGAFRSRKYQLWQFVFSKRGVRGGYRSVR